MLLAILMVIYRNPVTVAAPGDDCRIPLMTAQCYCRRVARRRLAVSNQAIVLLSANDRWCGNGLRRFPNQPLSRGACGSVSILSVPSSGR